MRKTCGNKTKHTCGTISYATCTRFEGTVNPQSELVEEECLDLEQTTQDIYNQLEDINTQIDLSALGEKCLEYLTDDEDRIVVKNVLIKFEEEICLLKTKVEQLETTDICNKPITACNLDLACLDLLPCDAPIETLGDLLQAMINKICE